MKLTSEVSCNKIMVHGLLWHERLGHPYEVVVQQVLKSITKTISSNTYPNVCSACQIGKST